MLDSRIFGDYNTIKQVGQGSLGTVYLSEHRFMKKQYMLKVLADELSTDRAFIQRMEEEVAVLAALDHPNIVKIHNISFAQGHYFLVTDCIVDELGETTNLIQYLLAQKEPLSQKAIYHILYQLAEALKYAHQKKLGGKAVPHRGIKLNNILIGKNLGDYPEVYLSDYGLSRIIGTSTVLTRTYYRVAEALGMGSMIPTSKTVQERYPTTPFDSSKLTSLHLSFLQNYAFLAPEQKREDQQQFVDIKADIYAFGVLAYFLLMQEFPEGYFEMPSERLLESDWNWDELIQSCLNTNALKRPDADQLLALLDSISNPSHKKQKAVSEAISHSFQSEPKEIKETPAMEQPSFLTLQRTSPKETVELVAAHAPQQLSSHSGNQAVALKPVIRVAEIERPQTDLDPASVFQIDTTVKYYTPELREAKNMQPILTEMSVINGGLFWRGSNDGNRDEMPRNEVSLESFAIDIHPVTNEQFVRFLDAMGGEKDTNHHDIIRMRDSRIKRNVGKVSIESGYAKHPVVGVTWYGAVAYAKWVGKRLPTEAEWEIAAYGGLENALYQTGDDIEKSQANFFSADTTPVMSYAPNESGLFDMAGNVYEWCQDWYGYNYYEISIQEPENPKGPLQGVYRVLRGGCWKSLKEDLRCSRRHRNNPGTVNGTYGFRCAADVQ